MDIIWNRALQVSHEEKESQKKKHPFFWALAKLPLSIIIALPLDVSRVGG